MLSLETMETCYARDLLPGIFILSALRCVHKID